MFLEMCYLVSFGPYFLSLILLWFFFTVCYLNFKFSLYKLVGEQLAVYVSDGVPEMLIGDPGRFRQIITNLMGNSIKVSTQPCL